MLRTMRQGSRWIMWIVILGVGGVFVFYLGIGGGRRGAAGADPETVVAVGSRRFDVRDVFSVRLRQEAEYRRVLGDGFDPNAASDMLDEAAANMVLRTALLAGEAERLGLRVSNEEIRAFLRQLAGANDGERIDEELVTNYAQREYGTLKRFEQTLRDDLMARKAQRLIGASVSVSDAEARAALLNQREEVSIALVQLEPDELPEGTEPDAAEVARILAEETDSIREDYEARRSEFDRPEQVSARHILVRIPEGADEAAIADAEARAQALRERIEAGASFEDVALEASEDPGSQSRGGDLGWFPRGRMVKEFEDAAFGAEVGALLGPVKSPFGFHIIRVEDHREAHRVPFDEAQNQIARERALERLARKAVRVRADEIAARLEAGASLVEVAREEGLDIRRPDPIRRRPDGYIPDLGAAPEVMTAAFALRPEAPTDPHVYETDGGYVLLELLDRKSPTEAEIEAALPELREELRASRTRAIEETWLETRRDELSARGELVYNLEPLRG